jgi:hypothetical protein
MNFSKIILHRFCTKLYVPVETAFISRLDDQWYNLPHRNISFLLFLLALLMLIYRLFSFLCFYIFKIDFAQILHKKSMNHFKKQKTFFGYAQIGSYFYALRKPQQKV